MVSIYDVIWNPTCITCLVLGYLISLFGGHLAIYPSLSYIFRTIKDTTQLSTRRYAAYVGLVERAIYTTLVICGYSEAIGGWIILKAILEFKSEKRSMASYYAYILGNGLSILFGVIGGMFILLMWKRNL